MTIEAPEGLQSPKPIPQESVQNKKVPISEGVVGFVVLGLVIIPPCALCGVSTLLVINRAREFVEALGVLPK